MWAPPIVQILYRQKETLLNKVHKLDENIKKPIGLEIIRLATILVWIALHFTHRHTTFWLISPK
jgi:hypothetical protein